MIRPWVAVFTSFHKTPIFGRIWVAVFGLVVYASFVELLAVSVDIQVTEIGAQFQGFLGLVLGLLLAFRTNTSYDRWWEGRRLWGQLVNDIRNLAIKVQTCVRAPEADKQRLGRWLCDFAIALKDHLRGRARLDALPGFTSHAVQPAPEHVPAYVSTRIYEQFELWRQGDQLGGFELLFLDQHAASLMNVCGACERIQKSPISLSYRWFMRQSIALYLLTLPWGLMQSFGWWVVPTVAMLGYFMIGVEMIAEAIEDPFGFDEDDIDLDELCRGIEQSVNGIIDTPLILAEQVHAGLTKGGDGSTQNA
jgi:putative membrane protein